MCDETLKVRMVACDVMWLAFVGTLSNKLGIACCVHRSAIVCNLVDYVWLAV
jgi:hypothetical protein